MSKREKWIASNAEAIAAKWRADFSTTVQDPIEKAIRLGLENADKIKDDEYEIDTRNDVAIRLRRNSILIATFWCGHEGEPTKEQVKKAAQAVIKVLQEQDDVL
jgi:hypothetical protein